MNTRLPPAPEATPTILCRCCNRPARVHFQPGFLDHPGHWELTCDTSECPLGGYTLGVSGYHDLDLTPYLKPVRKKRTANAL